MKGTCCGRIVKMDTPEIRKLWRNEKEGGGLSARFLSSVNQRAMQNKGWGAEISQEKPPPPFGQPRKTTSQAKVSGTLPRLCGLDPQTEDGLRNTSILRLLRVPRKACARHRPRNRGKGPLRRAFERHNHLPPARIPLSEFGCIVKKANFLRSFYFGKNLSCHLQ